MTRGGKRQHRRRSPETWSESTKLISGHEKGLGGVLAAVLTRTDDHGQVAQELAQWKQFAEQSGIDFDAAMGHARAMIQDGYRAPRGDA